MASVIRVIGVLSFNILCVSVLLIEVGSMPVDDLLVAWEPLKEHAGLRCMHPHFCSYAIRALEKVKPGGTSVGANALEYFAQAVLGRVDELDNSLASL
ncbi:hypothetical protein, partial [Pseudomonas asplenii]|uniref:hypothetical protein n=1 Tax=Pseudomonas asplenii TaxID=53407 RepID=UPI0012FC1F39